MIKIDNMKKLLIMALTVISMSTFAQKHNSETDLIQTYFGVVKKDLVTQYMSDITADRATAFWTIYDEYEAERQQLIRSRVENIIEYAEKYGTLNDESAKKITVSLLENDKKLIKLEEKYLKKMTKVVGGLEAAKFIQLETFLRNWIFSQVQGEMPPINTLNIRK